jgi:hypothetical protein
MSTHHDVDDMDDAERDLAQREFEDIVKSGRYLSPQHSLHRWGGSYVTSIIAAERICRRLDRLIAAVESVATALTSIPVSSPQPSVPDLPMPGRTSEKVAAPPQENPAQDP